MLADAFYNRFHWYGNKVMLAMHFTIDFIGMAAKFVGININILTENTG